MTREEFEYNLTKGDDVIWPERTVSVLNCQDWIKESQDVVETSGKNDKIVEPRFKTAVRKVMKRLKLMTKGIFIDDGMPDPEDIPIEFPVFSDYHSNVMENDKAPTNNFEVNSWFTFYLPGSFQEKLELNSFISDKGYCILRRNSRNRICRVEEISDESSCRDFFDWFTCYHLMPNSAQIIILDKKLKIVQAFRYLLRSHWRAAPIWDSEISAFIAMFTITDFIKFLHRFYILDISAIDNIESFTIQNWIEIFKTIGNVQFIYLSPNCTLRKAVSTIRVNNIHRVPVLDPLNGNLLSIITNSHLFRFFYQKFIIRFGLPLPNYMSHLPFDLGIGNYHNNVTTIHPWQTIYEALDMFMHNQISALPVVDDNNKLIDVYARYDIVALAELNLYKNLDSPIAEALKCRKIKGFPCVCKMENNLRQIMDIIYKIQVHRVYIVDDENLILGVISLSDILTFIAGV